MSEEWQRLDPRTLLTHPISSAVQSLVSAAFVVFAVGQSAGFGSAFVVGAAIVIAPGVARWLTTTYRVTASHLEVRRGVLSRSTLTARLDRVRSVDAQAAPVHRLLGVTKLSIGTGVDEGHIELDAVSTAAAEQLRRALLHRGDGPVRADDADEAPARPTAQEIARLSWSWVRYAPLNVGQLLVVAGAATALLGKGYDRIASQEATRAWRWVDTESVPLLLGGAVIGGLVAWVLLSVGGYALRWAGLTLTREHGTRGSTLRLTHGALTHQSTTLEEAKIRGVVLRRRALVGLAGGAELDVLTTGLGEEQARLLPSAPAGVVRAAACDVIGEDAAVDVPAIQHGPAARKRCHRRALRTAAVVAILADIATWLVREVTGWNVSWWWPIGVLVVAVALCAPLAELRYHRLGHALTARHLVSTSGGVTAERTVLATDGIIGWRIHRSFWDRRLGLAQLTATTAAGPEHVTVADIALPEAVALAVAATPAMLAEFVTETGAERAGVGLGRVAPPR